MKSCMANSDPAKCVVEERKESETRSSYLKRNLNQAVFMSIQSPTTELQSAKPDRFTD